jgi:hypothetical protein
MTAGTGALRSVAALGRTSSDREMLDHALQALDARHRLASKIAAEPRLAAVLSEFVTRLIGAFGSLAVIRPTSRRPRISRPSAATPAHAGRRYGSSAPPGDPCAKLGPFGP